MILDEMKEYKIFKIFPKIPLCVESISESEIIEKYLFESFFTEIIRDLLDKKYIL
jgi:hypothetical protein